VTERRVPGWTLSCPGRAAGRPFGWTAAVSCCGSPRGGRGVRTVAITPHRRSRADSAQRSRPAVRSSVRSAVRQRPPAGHADRLGQSTRGAHPRSRERPPLTGWRSPLRPCRRSRGSQGRPLGLPDRAVPPPGQQQSTPEGVRTLAAPGALTRVRVGRSMSGESTRVDAQVRARRAPSTAGRRCKWTIHTAALYGRTADTLLDTWPDSGRCRPSRPHWSPTCHAT